MLQAQLIAVTKSARTSCGAGVLKDGYVELLESNVSPGNQEHGALAALCAPTAADRIRLLLVEDHLVLREGLKALLQINPELEIVGEAGTVAEALTLAERLKPTIVLTDIALPDRSGIALVNELRLRKLDCHVVVLTAYKTEEYIRTALDAGARGYILKDASSSELVQGLHAVVAGRKFLCQAISDMLVGRYMMPPEQLAPAPLALLTERESEVLTRIARGESNKRMARALVLSVKTVEKHRSNLMRKLMLHNTAEVTLFAIRQGIINQF
jgi:DNA-binding NarL/FixJ family response regulator